MLKNKIVLKCFVTGCRCTFLLAWICFLFYAIILRLRGFTVDKGFLTPPPPPLLLFYEDPSYTAYPHFSNNAWPTPYLLPYCSFCCLVFLVEMVDCTKFEPCYHNTWRALLCLSYNIVPSLLRSDTSYFKIGFGNRLTIFSNFT